MILVRKVLQGLARNRLSVFLFHKVPLIADPFFPNDVSLAGFTSVLDFIDQNFTVLPFSEAAFRLSAGRLQKGAACITFDDGYSDWMTGVVPLLEQRNMHATFFITTGQFFGHPMWHERLANIVRHASGSILDTSAFRLPPLPIGNLAERRKAVLTLEYHFKYLPIVIRDRFLKEFEESTATTQESLNPMKQEQLKNISSRGFAIGSHTIEHPILSLCDATRARKEIGETKEDLEAIIKTKVSAFAYPNGRPNIDFTHKHISIIKQLGYTHAVTTQWGAATTVTSPFQIPRFTPWGPDQGHMSLQVIRNLLAKPEYIKEVD